MHVGKAAALIVAAVVLGVIVLRDTSSGSFTAAPISRDTSSFTVTTLRNRVTTSTTAAASLHAKNTIKVVAINASGTKGRASQATTKLQQAGYNALQAGNATQAVTNSHPASVIYVVTPGYERDAQELVGLFGLPASAVRSLPDPPPSPDIKDANIVVLVGSGITL